MGARGKAAGELRWHRARPGRGLSAALWTAALLLCGNVAEAQAVELAAPLAPAPAHGVEVHVETSPPGLHVRHDDSGAECEGDCTLRLEPTAHRFTLSMPGHSNEVEGTVVVDRPGLLRASYVRRSGTRASGWTVFTIGMSLTAIGGGVGTALAATGEFVAVGFGIVAFAAAGLNLVLALALGLPLASVGDAATIRFE